MGVNADGSIEMKSSNYHGDEKVSTDTVAADDPNILGYHTPDIPTRLE